MLKAIFGSDDPLPTPGPQKRPTGVPVDAKGKPIVLTPDRFDKMFEPPKQEDGKPQKWRNPLALHQSRLKPT